MKYGGPQLDADKQAEVALALVEKLRRSAPARALELLFGAIVVTTASFKCCVLLSVRDLRQCSLTARALQCGRR